MSIIGVVVCLLAGMAIGGALVGFLILGAIKEGIGKGLNW